MTDRISRCLRDLPDKLVQWNANISHPYLRACSVAHKSHENTLKL